MLPSLSQRIFAAMLLCLGLAGCRSATSVPPEQNARLLDDRGIDDPVLRSAAANIDDRRGDEAFEQLVEWFDVPATATSENRDVALYLAANALIAENKRIKGFYYLDELLDTYRSSDLFVSAAKRQYAIADSYLQGNGDRALGFLPYRNYDAAIEMLFRIQLRVPGSQLAEQSLLRSADFYYDKKDFDFAEDAYTVFLERYPRSPEVPRVLLRQAWSNLNQYRGEAYDPTPLIDGRQQLQYFAAAYPELAEANDVQTMLDWIENERAAKIERHAKYYDRVGEERSAYNVREQLIAAFPQTPAAAEARRHLDAAPPTSRPGRRLVEPGSQDTDPDDSRGDYGIDRPTNPGRPLTENDPNS